MAWESLVTRSKRLVRLLVSAVFTLSVVLSPIKTLLLYTGDGSVIRSYHVSHYSGHQHESRNNLSSSTEDQQQQRSSKVLACSPEEAYLNKHEVRAYNRGCGKQVQRQVPPCRDLKLPIDLSTKCLIAYDKPIFGHPSRDAVNATAIKEEEDDVDFLPIVLPLGGLITIYAEILEDLLGDSCTKTGSCLQANLPFLFETVAANVDTEVEQVVRLVQQVAAHGDPEDIADAVSQGSANMFVNGEFLFGLISSSFCPGGICYSNGASSSFIKSAGAVSTLVSDIWSAEQTDDWLCGDYRCEKTKMSVGVERNYIAGITMLNAKGFLEMHGCTEILSDLMELKYEVPDTLQRIPLEMALYLRCPALKTGIISDLEHITAISSALRLKVEQHSAAGVGSLREVAVSRTVLQSGLTTTKAADIVQGIFDGQNAGYIANVAWCGYVNGSAYLLDQDKDKLSEPMLASIRSCLQRRWQDTYRRTKWITRMAIDGSLTVSGERANVTIVFRERKMIEHIRRHLSLSGTSLPMALSSSFGASPTSQRYSFISRGIPLEGEVLSNLTSRVLESIFPSSTAGGATVPLTLNGPAVTLSLLKKREAAENVSSDPSLPPQTTSSLYIEPNSETYLESSRQQFDKTSPLLASCIGSPCQATDPFFLPSDQSLIIFDSSGLSYRMIDREVAQRLNASARDLSTEKNSIYAMEFYGRRCPYYPHWITMRGRGGGELQEGSEIEVSLVSSSAILENRMGYREACFFSSSTEFGIYYGSANQQGEEDQETSLGEREPRLGEGCSFKIHRITFLDPIECGNIMRGSDSSKRLNIYDSTEGESLIALSSSVLETVETTSNGLRSYENGIIYIGILINAIYTVGLVKQIISRVRIVSRVLSTFDHPTAKKILLFYNGPLIEFVDYTERQMARCSLIEKIALCLPSMVTLARMIRPIARLDSGVIVAEQYILITRGAMAETTSSQWLIWLIAALSVGSVMTATPDMRGGAFSARLRRWSSATVSPVMLILTASGVCIIAEDLLPLWLRSKVEIGLFSICWAVIVAFSLLRQSVLSGGSYISVKTKDALGAGAVLDKLGRPVDLVLPMAMIRPAPTGEEEKENKVMLNVFWVLNHIIEAVAVSPGAGRFSVKRTVRPVSGGSFSLFAIILYRPGQLEVKMTDVPPEVGVSLGTLPTGTTVFFNGVILTGQPSSSPEGREKRDTMKEPPWRRKTTIKRERKTERDSSIKGYSADVLEGYIA